MKNRRIFTVEGNDYERGLAIGKALKDRIRINYKNQTKFYAEQIGARNKNFKEFEEECKESIPFIEKYAPHSYLEMKGTADGAEIPFEQVLALTAVYELASTSQNVFGKCTAFSAFGKYTKNGTAICGQTNDECVDEWLVDLDVVIKHINPDGPNTLVYTHPGIVGYFGMNDSGLGLLWQYIDNGERAPGLLTCCILREVLFCKNLDEAINFLESVPHTIPSNYLLTHKEQGIANVECYPSGVFPIRTTEAFCHTNNVLTEEKIDGCDKLDPIKHRGPNFVKEMQEEAYEGKIEGILEWSYIRLNRMRELVEENKGQIDMNVAKEFLRDHKHEPFSICSHNNIINTRWKTIASFLYDLENLEMSIAFGNACELEYMTVCLEE